MNVSLDSRLERLAREAEELPAFSGIKLLHIKRQVAEMLSLVGRGGFFAEYTKHDISHIDRMLASVEWLIPETTWRLLTPTDALLQLLAIYLHDVGMLVTEQEYAQRDAAEFAQFRESLFNGEHGGDYEAKVLGLGEEGAERFLYQEFVRMHHGERVRAWISGSSSTGLGAARAGMEAVSRLLEPLPPAFRDDLGLVCESHHRDDLDDVRRYLVSKPFGTTPAETANVQYAALVLRTADLLHITSDRTPTTMFRLISPSDPVSQQEWAKQGAVASIRSKPHTDKEGNVDLDAPRDTIEVFAEFTDEGGFFGLTEYLNYASQQLRQSAEWAAVSQRRHGSRYELPWRSIDDGNIQTKGFLRDTFEFTFDQTRVLDLLTGHTLYNNSDVVIRELVQNSLDAVRLQAFDSDERWEGQVTVDWDSVDRILTVTDNGTGMTQSVIENHLLKVGASRYQDPDFKRQYPDFAPISRFGIGVLSTFMIADRVTVITTHVEEPEGRQLSLRSVHGRYLIRLVDKAELKRNGEPIAEHGTQIRLHLRPSASLKDVERIVRYWVVVPRCKVQLTVDDEPPIEIGHGSPSAALVEWLQDDGMTVVGDGERAANGAVRVVETEAEGVTLAVAQIWSDHFKEWSFVRASGEGRPLGFCVEGIRVEDGSPGFSDRSVVAIANAVGQNAPRTNVARSGFEQSDQRTRAFERIYRLYAGAATVELDRLHQEQRFSLTWVAQEARWVTWALMRGTAYEPGLLYAALATLPAIVVDEGDVRKLSSVRDLQEIDSFWTIHSGFYQSAEALLREMPTSVSVDALSRALGVDTPPLEGVVITGSSRQSALTDGAFEGKEVALIRLRSGERRADFEWRARTEQPRWVGVRPLLWRHPELRRRYDGMDRFERTPGARIKLRGVFVPREGFSVEGRGEQIGVKLWAEAYLLPDAPLVDYLAEFLDRIRPDQSAAAVAAQLFVFHCVADLLGTPVGSDTTSRQFKEYVEETLVGSWNRGMGRREEVTDHLDLDSFAEALAGQPWSLFDPYSWKRQEGGL